MSYLGYNKRPKIKDPKANVRLADDLEFEVDFSAIVFPNIDFRPIEDQASGYPLNWNLVFKGFGWTAAQFQSFFRNRVLNPEIVCNGVNNSQNGFQLISTHGVDYTPSNGEYNQMAGNLFRFDGGTAIQEIYDLNGVFHVCNNYVFHSCSRLEVVDLPGLTFLHQDPMYNDKPLLRVWNMPKMTNINNAPAGTFDIYGNSIPFKRCPQGCNFTLNNALKTANAGAMHGDVQWLINNKNPNITWVD